MISPINNQRLHYSSWYVANVTLHSHLSPSSFACFTLLRMFSFTAGGSSAGASSEGSTPTVHASEDGQETYRIYRRPFHHLVLQMRYDAGFRALSSDYGDMTMSCTAFDKSLPTLHHRVKANVMNGLRSIRGYSYEQIDFFFMTDFPNNLLTSNRQVHIC